MGQDAVQQRHRPDPEGLRLRHQPGVDQAEAGQRSRFLQRLLRRDPGRRDARRTTSTPNATSIADLHDAKLGAQEGTTSFDAINEVIKPGTTPLEYPTNVLAVQALKNGTIDGLVVDFPTGLFVTAVQVEDSTIVGQLAVTGEPEQFGLVLDKGSSLTDCVSQAVDALRDDGTLEQLQQQWLESGAGAPVLK